MLGFEVSINGEVVKCSVESGRLEVVFTACSQNEHVFIWGLESFQNTWWYSSVIECAKITVRIADVSHNSAFIKNKSRFKDDEEMLRKYYELRQELEKEGLL